MYVLAFSLVRVFLQEHNDLSMEEEESANEDKCISICDFHTNVWHIAKFQKSHYVDGGGTVALGFTQTI